MAGAGFRAGIFISLWLLWPGIFDVLKEARVARACRGFSAIVSADRSERVVIHFAGTDANDPLE